MARLRLTRDSFDSWTGHYWNSGFLLVVPDRDVMKMVEVGVGSCTWTIPIPGLKRWRLCPFECQQYMSPCIAKHGANELPLLHTGSFVESLTTDDLHAPCE
jgi:hypothetical protein